MKLYWHPFSIMPWRIRIALHEKGIPYESIQVDVYGSRHRTPDFLAMNPFGQIPVLEHDGVTISESIAILEYLEERYPRPALLPADVVARAMVRQWMCWSTDYWPPAWKQWMAPRLGVEWTDASVAEGRQTLAAHLDVIESRLARRDWLVGDYSLADVCYAPLVLVLDRVGLEAEVSARRSVALWVKRLSQRPAIVETLMRESDR
ncbi:MAG TPA: glutathione S-transferase family protein [Pseudomonadales bacterium]